MVEYHQATTATPGNEAESLVKNPYIESFLACEISDFPVQKPLDLVIDGVSYHTVEYPHVGAFRGVIFYMPGYGEYCDLVGAMLRPFAEQGFRVFGFDRHGFGKSGGRRGDIGRHCYEDCITFVTSVVEKFSLQGARKYLLGVSMGGLLSATMTAEMSGYFDGVILDVPWFANHQRLQVSRWVRGCLGVLKYCFRNYSPNSRKPGAFTDFLVWRQKTYPLYSGPIQLHCLDYGLNLQDRF